MRGTHMVMRQRKDIYSRVKDDFLGEAVLDWATNTEKINVERRENWRGQNLSWRYDVQRELDIGTSAFSMLVDMKSSFQMQE